MIAAKEKPEGEAFREVQSCYLFKFTILHEATTVKKSIGFGIRFVCSLMFHGRSVLDKVLFE